MSEIDMILGLCGAGLLHGSIENCIVVAHDNGSVATATNAAKELAEMRAEIKRLENKISDLKRNACNL